MKPTPEQIVADVIAALPDKWQWFWLDRGDTFYDEQIDTMLRGGSEGDGWQEIEETLDNNWSDYRWQRQQEQIKEAFEDAGHAEHRDLLTDANENTIIETLWDRDESDPMGELLRATGSKFFRYSLADRCEIETDYTSDETDIDEQVAHIAAATGIDVELNCKALEELIVNASYGGTLYVFWYGDPERVVKWCVRFGNPLPKTITWTNPTLLILDRWNGSGHEVDVQGTITLPFEADKFEIDSRSVKGHGYSWNETCGGLHGPAYGGEPTITEQEAGDAEGQAE